jgi:hypothetical protein
MLEKIKLRKNKIKKKKKKIFFKDELQLIYNLYL